MAKETKTEVMTIRVRPSTKTSAERNAEEDGRSVANYVEWLISQDTQRRKDKR